MSSSPDAGDVRRRAGWLPDSQEDLESWLTGHRERVEAKGEQLVWHPVLAEFQHLIDTDPIVGMYLERMIAQVPQNRHYRKRHLTSVEQLLRLINEVLTIAPEFGDQAVTLPRSFQDQVSLRIVKGLRMTRPASRLASVMSPSLPRSLETASPQRFQ